jgi:hypothetical protein
VRQGIGEHRDPDCRRYSDEQCCPFRHSSDQTAAHVFCKCAATAAIFVTCVTTQDESAEVTLLKLLLLIPESSSNCPASRVLRPVFGASARPSALLTRNGSAVSGG